MGRRAIDGRSGGLFDTAGISNSFRSPPCMRNTSFMAAAATSMGSPCSASDATTARNRSRSPAASTSSIALFGPRKPFRAEVGNGRDRRHDNFGFRELLNVPQQPLLARVDHRDRRPFTPCPPGPSDPMDIAFRRRGQIVVHHMRHRWNIQPPRRHIGGDEEFGLPGSKRIHHAIALGLIHPAMDRFGSMPAAQSTSRSVHRLRYACGKRQGPTSELPYPKYEPMPSLYVVWRRYRPFDAHAARRPL